MFLQRKENGHVITLTPVPRRNVKLLGVGEIIDFTAGSTGAV